MILEVWFLCFNLKTRLGSPGHLKSKDTKSIKCEAESLSIYSPFLVSVCMTKSMKG